jgi:Ulp1 family protease
MLFGFEERMNMKTFDLVLFPIIEDDHYYLICFALKNVAIEVVDNMDESTS